MLAFLLSYSFYLKNLPPSPCSKLTHLPEPSALSLMLLWHLSRFCPLSSCCPLNASSSLLPSRNRTEATEAGHICNYSFSNSHKKRGKKETGDINFHNIFHLTQYIQNIIISMYNQKVIFKILCILLTRRLQNVDCILCLQHTSQFE